MALKSTAKSQATMRLLKDNLKMRLASTAGVALNTVRESNDSEGWAMLFVSVAGNEAAEQPVIALRCRAIDAVSKDVFGNDMFAFTPHIIEIASDATAVTVLQLKAVQHEADQMGMTLQLKTVTADAAVTAASMDTATVEATFDWLRWPTKGS